MSEKEPKEKNIIPKRWIGCDIEAEYFGEDRKISKQDRKIASAKDRSKYKKTDWGKFKKSEELHKNIKLSKQDLLRGRVLSINPQGFVVEYEGKNYICTLRGLLKKDKSLYKNLVTVGDFVLFQKTNDQEAEGSIYHVEPRKSILSRADNLSRRKEQLIAANIDQVIITVSVVSPPLKPFLADRYIIASRKGNMEPIIIVNKIDLFDDLSYDQEFLAEEKELYEAFLKGYQELNIPIIPMSIEKGYGLDELRTIMRDKASVFSGQSGVGKTSIINAVTGLDLRTGKIVEKTKKGSHTTTTASLIPLEFGGWCIDTPGIKSFGVWSLKQEEIETYFSEIHDKGRQCKYPDCSHTHESDCAVINAVEADEISFVRYQSYINLIDSLSHTHLRR